MVEHPSKIKISSQDCFLFDTNIWIILFYPLSNHKAKEQEIYSNLLNQILIKKATIINSSLIFSEYVNACFNMAFEDWKKSTQNHSAKFKKDFRNTERYQEVKTIINSSCQKIEKHSLNFNDEFQLFRYSEIEKSLNCSDFNDAYYTWLANRKSFRLVTNDSDFLNLEKIGLKIITAHFVK